MLKLSNIKNLLSGIGIKKLIIIAICFIVGVMLILMENNSSDSNVKVSKEDSGIYYSELLEKRVEAFIETIDGIDEACVFITIDCGTEYEYAKKGGDSDYAVDYLIIKNDSTEEAAVVREIYPLIRGIAVSCTGGENAVVKEKIVGLLSAGLGIPSHKIKVAGN